MARVEIQCSGFVVAVRVNAEALSYSASSRALFAAQKRHVRPTECQVHVGYCRIFMAEAFLSSKTAVEAECRRNHIRLSVAEF